MVTRREVQVIQVCPGATIYIEEVVEDQIMRTEKDQINTLDLYIS